MLLMAGWGLGRVLLLLRAEWWKEDAAAAGINGEMVVSFRKGTFGMLPPLLLTCLTLDETSNLNFFLMYKKWKKQDLSISLPPLMRYGAQIMVVTKYLCCKQFTKKPIKMMVTLNLGKAI